MEIFLVPSSSTRREFQRPPFSMQMRPTGPFWRFIMPVKRRGTISASPVSQYANEAVSRVRLYGVWRVPQCKSGSSFRLIGFRNPPWFIRHLICIVALRFDISIAATFPHWSVAAAAAAAVAAMAAMAATPQCLRLELSNYRNERPWMPAGKTNPRNSYQSHTNKDSKTAATRSPIIIHE